MKDARQTETPWAGTIAVLAAASLFATSGTIIKHLTQGYGVPPLTVATVRITVAGLLLVLFLGVFDRKLLCIQVRDIPFFLLFGFICVTLFQTCWVYAVSMIDVGVATVLNYTAPAWTAILAWPLLGEKVDRRKLLALLLTVAGVALIARIFDARFLSLNSVGLLWGLGSGVTYGLYGILGRRALRRYSSWTSVTYTFIAGALFLWLTQTFGQVEAAFVKPGAALWLVLLALVPTLGGYTLYTLSLRFLKATVAAILSTVEPVIAALIATAFLGERLSWPQVIGVGLVVSGVITLQMGPKQVQAIQSFLERT